MPIFKREADFNEEDILFVKELIAGEFSLWLILLSGHTLPLFSIFSVFSIISTILQQTDVENWQSIL